ncbi:MAG: SMR family transporter [Candidatus Curtissbacteria bacterium]
MSFVQLLITSVILNVTGNFLLKNGVLTIGGISGEKAKIIAELTRAALNPFILSGLVLYSLSFVIWLRVLTISDLSRAYPIFATMVFLLTTIISIAFFKENVSAMRFVGIVIMLTGIFIVARY